MSRMHLPDLINACFELTSSLAVWAHVRQVKRDRGYAGISVPATVFFAVWGVWNMFYYPWLDQWASAVGGASISIANIVWVCTMLYYGKRNELRPGEWQNGKR